MSPTSNSDDQLKRELEAARSRIAALEAALSAKSKFERMLIALMNTITDIAACTVKPDGTIVMANRAFASYLDLDVNSVAGQNIFFSLPHYTAERYRLCIEESVASGKPVELRDEWQGRRVITSIYPIMHEAETIYVLLYLRDVTEKERRFDLLQRYRAQLEEMVHQRVVGQDENQRIFTTLMNNLPGMVYRCLSDSEWTMLFVSDGAVELTGYPPTALVQNKEVSYASIIHPDDRELVRVQVSRALEKKAPYQIEYRIITAAGDEKRVWEQGEGVWSLEGKLVALEGFITDITARREVEEALQEVERRYRELFEGGNDAVCMISLEGILLTANQRAVELLGYEHDELIGSSFEQFVVPEERGKGRARLEALLHGEPVPIYERNVVHKSGRIIPVEINTAMVHDRNGAPLYVQSVVRDISDRHRYIRRLEGLHEIDRAILLNQSPEIIAQEALNYLHNLIPYQRATVNIFDLEAGEFWYIAGKIAGSDSLPLNKRMPIEGNLRNVETLSRKVMHVVSDVKTEKMPRVVRQVAAQGVHSYVNIPLTAQGKLIGALNVGRDEVGEFPPKDIEIMQEVANQLAVAIFNGRLLEAEREQRVVAQALYDVSAVLNSSLSFDDVLARILDGVERVVPHDGASIMQVDGDRVHTVRMQGYDFDPAAKHAVSRLRKSVDDVSSLRYMYREHQALVIPDTCESDVWMKTPQTEWVRSYLGAPIIIQNEVRGFINLDSRRPNAFGEKDMEHLRAFADQAAVALNNARMYEALHQYSQGLERAVEARTAEFRRAREQAETILYNSPTATLLLAAGGVIEAANPALYALFGVKADDIIGTSLTDLFVPEDCDTVLDALAAAVQQHQFDHVELTGCNSRGETFDAEMVLSPVEQEDELLGIVCNIRNISAFKTVERLKDEFVSTAAHELRTPLTSVRGFSEILLTRQLDDERRSRYLMLINQQAMELAHIIDELLDISRMETRQAMALKREAVNVPTLLRETLEPFADVSPHHQFVVEAADDLPLVMGDPFRLAQVIRNLVSNAVKYSPDGGRITVGCELRENVLAVSVQDEGIGMTPEEQAHLFEKFYRARTVPGISGTGLGLTICRLIVESHGGKIAVESAVGKGSTVTFTLPLDGDLQSAG